MPYHWKRPTPEQSARKIIAVYVLTHYLFVDGKAVVLEMPCPYFAHNIELRIANGFDLPYWITVNKPVCVDCRQDTGVFIFEHGKLCGACTALHHFGIACFEQDCNRYTDKSYDDLPMCPACMADYIAGLSMPVQFFVR